MADVTLKICDRCKKEILDRRGDITFRPVFTDAVVDFKFLERARFGMHTVKHGRFDLCETCSDEFVQFMNGGNDG